MKFDVEQIYNWRELYPFESHTTKINGRNYHYIDEGEGPTILMVHGNPTWSFYWRNLIHAFRKNYRVIAVDHIGCGLSDKPTASEYDFTLRSRIDDLKALVEELDLTDITLTAHDWGGAIGMGVAGELPERFSRFVLMNTGAFHGEKCPLRIRVCRIPLLGKIAVQGFNGFSAAAVKMAVSRTRLSKLVAKGLLAPYDSWANRLAVHQFVVDIPLSKGHRSWDTLQKVEDGLTQFRDHPVCLIWGMKDWCFTPRFLERFQGFFPNAQVQKIQDAGHYVVEDASDDVIETMAAFLAANADSTQKAG
jgi:cis-3-alkyl-4-acyloxetan-2-one decarboxylase